MHMKHKKGIAILLTLAMVFSILPTGAVWADWGYSLWVGGEQFTNDKLTIYGTTGTATYDPTTNTLTLNNYTYTGPGRESAEAAILYEINKPLNLVLVGTSSVTQQGTPDKIGSYGFFSPFNNGSITVSGTGSLTVKSGPAVTQSTGVLVYAGITVSEYASLTAEGGTSNYSYGVSTSGVTVSGNGVLTAKSGTATGASDSESYGVYASDAVTVSDNGSLTAIGNTADGDFGKSYGVAGIIKINGGTTIAQGNNGAFYAFYNNHNIAATHAVYGSCGAVIENPVWTDLTYAKIANASETNPAHDLTYSASGDTITESCAANCGHTGTATITAANATYDGTAKETATVAYSDSWTGGTLTPTYANNINVGTATASITTGSAIASVDFNITPSHTHILGTKYSTTEHWQECTAEGCPDLEGSKANLAAHNFDNDCDTDCNDGCGYIRQTSHSPLEDWIEGENGHWHDCEFCGADLDFAAHNYKTEWSYDEAWHWHECAECGYDNTVVGHIYDTDADTTCICGYTRTVDSGGNDGSEGTGSVAPDYSGGYIPSTPSVSDKVEITVPDTVGDDVNVEAETITTSTLNDVKDVAADDETLSVIGGKDSAVQIVAKENGKAVESFTQPVSVTVPVSKADIKHVTDTGKLTLALVTTDENGDTQLTYVGGKYDADKGTFSAYTDKPGNYVLVEKDDLIKIELTIDHPVADVNGRPVVKDVPSRIVDDRTLVPARFVLQHMGCGIDWNGDTRTVIVTLPDGTVLTMAVDEPIPGFGAAPMIEDGRTLVPVAYIAYAMEAHVLWVEDERRVIIVK